jgi:hypothetical protein
MTITHTGEDENKPWLIPVDVLTDSPLAREAVGYSAFL